MDVKDAMFHYTSAPHRSMDEYTAFVFDSFRDCTFASAMRWVCWSTRVGSGTRRRARLDAPWAGTPERVTGHTVVTTVDRSVLRAVQTPQGFRREVLERAHGWTGGPLTDDAGLVEAAGVTVTTVAGDDEAFKVTRPLDLVLAEALLRREPG